MRLWPHGVSSSLHHLYKECRMKIKWPCVHCYLDLQILTARWCHYLSVDVFKHNLFQPLRIPLPTVRSKRSENVKTSAGYSQLSTADNVADSIFKERKVNMGLWRANPFLDHCVYMCTVTTVTCTCAHVCTEVPLFHHHGASLSKLHTRDHQTRFQVSLSSFPARSWGETVRTFDSLIPSSGCPVPTQQSPQTQLLPDVAQKAGNQPRVVNAIRSQWAWAASQHQSALVSS